MTKFYFVIYGIIHAGDKIEAKSFLQEIVKEGQFEHLSAFHIPRIPLPNSNKLGISLKDLSSICIRSTGCRQVLLSSILVALVYRGTRLVKTPSAMFHFYDCGFLSSKKNKSISANTLLISDDRKIKLLLSETFSYAYRLLS